MSETRPRGSDRWRRIGFDAVAAVSFAAICAAMLMTVGDIALRLAARIAGLLIGQKPGWGLFGLVDLTQLAMMAAMPLAIAAAFVAGAHIRVDLFLGLLSDPTRRAVARLSALCGIGLMGPCLWTAWTEMRGQLDFTTTSATLGISYTWYWLPLIAGLALSLLACAAAMVRPPDGAGPDA